MDYGEWISFVNFVKIGKNRRNRNGDPENSIEEWLLATFSEHTHDDA